MESLSERHVRAVAPVDGVPHSYFVFADGRLWRTGTEGTRAEPVAEVPEIRAVGDGTGDGRSTGKQLEIQLHVRGPWVCVSERFGVNAALVNAATGSVRGLSREDYHSDVSSYSIGFLDWEGRTLLLAQTQWNRLDIFDAETGANLTEREVFNRDSGRLGESGRPEFILRNHIDYFHSQLHVSPDSRHFLSNGWVWSPMDVVRVFSTGAFLDGYELTSVPVGPAFGYNWDRPCTFLDDRRFVLALDESVDPPDLEETVPHEYHQLAVFEIPNLSLDVLPPPRLEPSSFVDCDVFPRNRDGEVKGELHYDSGSGCLVALTHGNGSFMVSLNGDVVARMPDLSLASPRSHRDLGSIHSGPRGVVVRAAAPGVPPVGRRYGNRGTTPAGQARARELTTRSRRADEIEHRPLAVIPVIRYRQRTIPSPWPAPDNA